MQISSPRTLEDKCRSRLQKELYTKNLGSPAKASETIEALLSPTNKTQMTELQAECDSKECLKRYYEVVTANFMLTSSLQEDPVNNYLAMKYKDPRLMQLASNIKKRHDEEHPRETKYRSKSSTNEAYGREVIKLDFGEEIGHNVLERGESSSVIIDGSEFDLIDKAHQPDFVFENHFLKQERLDFDLGKIDWETRLHDIYEPQYTTLSSSTAQKQDSPSRDKKGFSVKYSFQQGEERRHMNGLDYFQSEKNVLQHRDSGSGNRRNELTDSVRHSPVLSKSPNLDILATNKSKLTAKEKARGTSKKKTGKTKKVAAPTLIMGSTGTSNGFDIGDMQLMRFKAGQNFFKAIGAPTNLKALKKKGSVLYPQTRSNSREQMKNSSEMVCNDLMALRSLKKERTENSSNNLKKKMRIRDRHENVPQKDNTNSVFLKKKKKKPDVPEQSLDQNLISKLLYKSLKNTKDSGMMHGLPFRPALNLEHSHLTDEVNSRFYESAGQKSPKFQHAVSRRMKVPDPQIEQLVSKQKVECINIA